jgi:hypothetical protein
LHESESLKGIFIINTLVWVALGFNTAYNPKGDLVFPEDKEAVA